MKPYATLSVDELKEELLTVQAEYEHLKTKQLRLDMSRGKPGVEQLKLSAGLLTALTDIDDCMDDGIDARNYGVLSGLPSAKRLFSELLDVAPERILIGGNASLQMMYTLISFAYSHGMKNSPTPWCKRDKLRFLCPVPGYDRHFRITEHFGIEMLSVPLTEQGPDMDVVERLVADPTVVGMWCVPKFSNPDGILYSEETVDRIARLRPACPDFLLMWDNAYCVHELSESYQPLTNIHALCDRYGTSDMVYEFASTSKITFPGAGISCIAASEANISYLVKMLTPQTIGFDKLNQLRHVRFLKDRATVLCHMQKHAALLRPRFDTVLRLLDERILPLGLAHYSRPKGGYFISLYALPHTAKRTVALCKEAGLVVTPAGAAYPYGIDPEDSNIRIAPSVPSITELESAMEILCVCLRLAALERFLSERSN